MRCEQHISAVATVPECPSPTDSDVNRKVFPLRAPLGFIFGSSLGTHKLNWSTQAQRVGSTRSCEVEPDSRRPPSPTVKRQWLTGWAELRGEPARRRHSGPTVLTESRWRRLKRLYCGDLIRTINYKTTSSHTKCPSRRTSPCKRRCGTSSGMFPCGESFRQQPGQPQDVAVMTRHGTWEDVRLKGDSTYFTYYSVFTGLYSRTACVEEGEHSCL